jgi:NAD(P)-dependent dehydrogenase (short-subunit alcohol dehydrogenase family)
MYLKGKTAVVTGGTKGIGRVIAESLVNAGVNVSFSARHESEIERTAAELNEAGPGRAAGFFCDVRLRKGPSNTLRSAGYNSSLAFEIHRALAL